MKSSRNQRVFDRGKGELESAKGCECESVFTFKMAFLEYFQTDLSPQQNKTLSCLQEKRVTPSIRVEKPSEPASTLQICFWYFISFNMMNIKNILNKTQKSPPPKLQLSNSFKLKTKLNRTQKSPPPKLQLPHLTAQITI